MATSTSTLRLRSINSPQALEGCDLLFDIAFVAAANVPTNLNLNFAGIADKGEDYQASFQASFDGGRSFKTYSGTGLDVPVGCTGVLVKVSSIEDQIFEKSERVTITASVNQDTLTSSGLIVNDDRPALTVVSVTGDEKVEGNNLVFTVKLDGNIPNTQFPPGSVCPHPAWTCTQDGGKGTIDLGGYSVTLQEHNSVWVLTNKATCTSTRIWGDPHVDIGNNGSTEFDFKKSMSFQLSDGTKITVDTVAWGNSDETLSSKLTITDWCGNKAMVVTGLGWDSDGVGNLNVQKIDGQGKALDLATPDGAFTLYENPNGNWNIFDGRAANQNLINKLESGELVDCGSMVNLSVAAGTAVLRQDFLAPIEVSMDNGVTWTLANAGSVRVPTGIDSFLARVATVDDEIAEIAENLTLSAKSGTSTASALGNILDNDAIPSTVTCVSSVTANEGEPLQFEVVLSGASTVSTNLTLNLANGTATGGVDFATTNVQVSFNNGWTWSTSSSNVISVPACTSSLLVKVAGIDDQVYEGPSEAFTLNASANGGSAFGIGTICENDSAPKVLSVSTASASEGDALNFTVRLTGASASETSVNLAAANGTADGSDYGDRLQVSFDGGVNFVNVVGASVNVPPGVISFEVRVASTEDSNVEADETFTLQASANGGSATGNAVILNDDAPPPLVQATVTCVSSVTANEGDPLQFEVVLSEASAVATNVILNLVNGTATGGLDFATTGVQVSFNGGQTWSTLATNNVSVPPGSASLLVKVAGLEDTVYEGATETFTLSASANGRTESGIGTICENDDAPKVLSISNASASEGDALNFHVAMTGSAISETTVNLAITNGTANGADFSNQLQASFDGGVTFVTLTGTSVTVPAGITAFEVRITSTEDSTVEADETFSLQASANGGSATATATILNDDVAPLPPPPSPPPVVEAKVLGVSCASANEGDPLQFEVTLDGAPATTNVTLILTSGTATANVDFATTGVQASFDNGHTWTTLTSNSVSVPAGSTSLLVKVQSIEDNIYEGGSETFSLTAATKLSSASGIGSILNDEEPILGISSVGGGCAIEGSFLQFDIGLHGTVSYPTVPPGSTCPPENWTFNQTGSSATIDLGNYCIQLQEKLASWTLLNKETGQCTRIWGDPHVDIGNDGQIDFDFKENMTFQLSDGTKITVDTVEWERSGQTLSSKLTITDWAGQNAMVVTGLGWFSDGVANLKVEEFEGQGQALDLGTSDGSMTLYENNAGGWKIFDGRAATQVLVDQLENGLLVDPGSTITLALSQGSATLGADYLDKLEVSMDGGKTWIATEAGTVRIPVGVDHLIARVPTIDDTTAEPLEHVRLTATASTTAGSADGTIFDNDATVCSYSVSLTEAPHVDTWVTVQVGGVTAQGATLFNSEGQGVDGSAIKVLVHAGETESQPFLLQNPANATGAAHLPLNLTITNLEAVTAQTVSANSDAPTLRDILLDTGEGEIDLAALGVQADPRLTATVVAGVESKLGAADIHGGAIDIEHLLHKPAAASEV